MKLEDTTDEQIRKVRDALEKDTGKVISWQEAKKVASSLYQFAGICIEAWQQDELRKKKLEESSKGFKLEGGYNCSVCGTIVGKEGWYDKWGIKCLTCQHAIDQKIIPPSIGKNKNTWYSDYDMESYFGLRKSDLRQLVKKQLLNARMIMANEKHILRYIFFIKENKEVLPPKKLVESKWVIEIVDGKEYYSLLPWYRFVDLHQHLKNYGIIHYLRWSI